VQPSFETLDSGSWSVVTVQGELDLSTAEDLRSALGRASGEGAPRLAVDLTAVTFLDSTILGVLVETLKQARERGGEMRLIGVHGSLAKVISITGLDSAFDIDATIADLPA
jgi:anti-sigma B factor antagonist